MPTGFDDSDELLEAYLAESGEADLAEQTPPRLWDDGREVGEWIVTGFLARGGNAEVYCAKHRRLGTRAALKVLWRDGTGPRERFETESRFLMGNPGPSFPAFHGAGVEDGRPWLAMELLDECPLPSSDRAVARYLLDVGEGVATLHAHGWLHRDIKPRNILRRADGRAVLADFGLLKAIGEDGPERAVAGGGPSVVDGKEVGVGTPGYSSPEQFTGGGATPAADVYALGMLAEECFGGNPPRVWEKIIRGATAALPRQRYPDVASLLRAIRRRHRARIWVRAGVAAVLAGALGVWWWSSWREEAPPATLAPGQPETPEAPEAPIPPETPAPPETPVVPVEPETPSPPEASAPPEAAAASPGVRATGVRAERAAALARFEAEEWRKEAILSLVDDMQANAPSRKYWISCRCGRHEVTQRQWSALMDGNPSRFQGGDLPVDSVTVGACLEFLERLNATSIAKEEDLRFRLPTAWEWGKVAENLPAVRNGERLATGWFAENAGGCTHPVGEKTANGPCADLFGNVRELTCSWSEVDGKEGFLCLGGSWADSAAGEDVPRAVLEQPQFIRRHMERCDRADPGPGTLPSDYPYAVCPAPGEIGFRLWAEPRNPPEDPGKDDLKEAVAHWENEARKEERW